MLSFAFALSLAFGRDDTFHRLRVLLAGLQDVVFGKARRAMVYSASLARLLAFAQLCLSADLLALVVGILKACGRVLSRHQLTSLVAFRKFAGRS